MQDEQQYQQLLLQYKQLRNRANDISRMIDREDYDSAITMIKTREDIFLNCKCIRRYLELTPEQEKELNVVIDELKTIEQENMSKLEKSMEDIQSELKRTQQTQKFQNAYQNNNTQSGSMLNLQE